MTTIHQIYLAYPASDLLPIEVTPETTLADVEAAAIGDTLFLFLCRELTDPEDLLETDEVFRRCNIAMRDICSVRNAIIPAAEQPHIVSILTTHIGAIYRLEPGTEMTLALIDIRAKVARDNHNCFKVTVHGATEAVGNVHGMLQWYLRTFLTSRHVLVLEDG